ncbi:MAG: gluconate transporter [Desertifilum sp. SIO1I2]|nr:gluconate transporter [Desertifilum sp. SIO1I2]
MAEAGTIFIAIFGIAFLLFLVIALRLQAFVALLLTSLLIGVIGGIPLNEIAQVIQTGMGNTLGYIAIVIGLGAMFGEMLQISGGAEQISQSLIKKFGEERAQWALGITGLLIAIPVFFDVSLILLIPLVYNLTRKTGRSILYYAIPLVAGIAVGHSYIPPTPGPVAVASLLGADLGWVILFGIIAGIPSMVIGGVFFGKFIAGKMHIPVPDIMQETSEPKRTTGEKTLPSFRLLMTILFIPIALILLNTVSGILLPEGNTIRNTLNFIGHPFSALMLAALLSFYTLGIQRGYTRNEVQQIATKALEPVGMIILVTGAGGVFGRVLVETGVGETLANLMAASNLPVILLAFAIATAVRVSQGSATVSMVTAAGLIAPVVETGNYSAPLLGLITIAIASGATVLSHVNDSGFWLVGRFLGMTEKQTLQSWTVMETIIGGVGFLIVFAISWFV